MLSGLLDPAVLSSILEHFSNNEFEFLFLCVYVSQYRRYSNNPSGEQLIFIYLLWYEKAFDFGVSCAICFSYV